MDIEIRADRSALGRIGIWGGVVGAVLALVMLLVTPAVGEDRYSFPFTTGVYSISQVVFAVQHLTMIAAVLTVFAVVRARVGLGIALAGLALLTMMELVAITAATEPLDGGWAQVVNTLYAVPTIVTGVGLVVAGLGIARARHVAGWARWVTLVTGIYVFVVLIPGIMGPFVMGRIVIGVWSLLFGALAWAAVRRRG
ncbi:hypothetical protein [Pseudonocardia xishanensis]|uniref:DUF4386 family protein n=1 Tax=Pseudonocardia xishanensis TaxID=630995 RepID=A0ABP8S0X9_9PSEU